MRKYTIWGLGDKGVWATSGYIQDLYLALCSGVTLAMFRGQCWELAEVATWKCLSSFAVSLAPERRHCVCVYPKALLGGWFLEANALSMADKSEH